MIVYADIKQKVSINPIDVIEKLKNKLIGTDNWVIDNNGVGEVWYDTGGHRYTEMKERDLTKKEYKLYKAYDLILNELKEK